MTPQGKPARHAGCRSGGAFCGEERTMLQVALQRVDSALRASDALRRRLMLRAWHRLRHPANIARMLSVDGMTRKAEMQLLYELAVKARDGCVVEIGTCFGASTVALGHGVKAGHGVPVYAIDPYLPWVASSGKEYGPKDRIRLYRNLLRAEVAEYVWLIQLKSEDVARNWSPPVSLLWIDGDHSYPATRKDLDCWSPFVCAGGTIAFHDSLRKQFGVWRVIEEALATGKYEKYQVVGQITALRKLA
jgi:MMP 1-O-methyltransferase